MSKNEKDTGPMVLVSFKVSKARYEELRRYAESKRDDAGNKLSVGLAARRLVDEGLKRPKK